MDSIKRLGKHARDLMSVLGPHEAASDELGELACLVRDIAGLAEDERPIEWHSYDELRLLKTAEEVMGTASSRAKAAAANPGIRAPGLRWLIEPGPTSDGSEGLSTGEPKVLDPAAVSSVRSVMEAVRGGRPLRTAPAAEIGRASCRERVLYTV